jgi:IS605 OrfB family transposase
MIITYKYRLKRSRSARSLRQFAWAVNQVWNFCTASQRKAQEIYRLGSRSKWPSQYTLQGLAKGTSKELGVHAQTVQGACECFARSRDQHKKCPKFRRSSGSKRSLGWVPFQEQSRQITPSSVTYLGRTYRFFGAKRRPLPANAKGGCFVEDSSGKWYVCFQVEVGNLPTGTGQVGIDLGLKTLATPSDGEKISNPTYFRKSQEKLAIAQRAGNKKRTKAIHAKMANQRKDYLHKVSNKLASANKLIVVGNVSASKLAKTSMAKSVLDAGWSTLRGFLAYKASRHQATFIEVNEAFTTQTCSACGDRSSEGRPKGIAGLGIREWRCSACGVTHDRDRNAALNILNLGLSAQPRVDESRRNA